MAAVPTVTNAYPIQYDEPVTCFLERLYRGGVTAHRAELNKLHKVTTSLGMPTNLARIAAFGGDLCPDVLSLMLGHTLHRVWSPFLRAGPARLLVQLQMKGKLPNVGASERLQKIRTNRTTVLGVCEPCLFEQEESPVGFATWRMLASIQGCDHCLVHMSPFLRTCERCYQGYSLEVHCLPSLRCGCGGRMRTDTHYAATPFATGVAQDFKLILDGELDDFAGEEVLSAIQQASAARGLTDPRDLSTYDAMLRDTEVEHYLQAQTKDVNVRRRLAKVFCGVSVSLTPYVNVAAVRHLFGSVSALSQHLRALRFPQDADRTICGAGMTDGQLVAARALLTETRIARPGVPANLLMTEAVTALHTAVAQNPEWVNARLAQEHVMRAVRRNEAEAEEDKVLAERLEERAKRYQQSSCAPRICANSLIEGELHYRKLRVYPKCSAVIARYTEDGLDFLRRKFRCLAQEFPLCLNESLARFLRERLSDACKKTMRGRLAELVARIEALASQPGNSQTDIYVARQKLGRNDADWAQEVALTAKTMLKDEVAERITATILVGGYFGSSERRRFPITAATLARCVESRLDHLRRLLCQLARRFPRYVDASLKRFLDQELAGAHFNTIRKHLRNLQTRIAVQQQSGVKR